jgi:hypothetical protein
MSVSRYLRAFVRALSMMLRGETPPAPRYPALRAWAEQTQRLLDQIVMAAEQSGLDRDQRQTMLLKVDGRAISLDAALQAIRHHAEVEYPYLLNHYNRYSLLTVQATNLNDRHLAQRLAAWDALPSGLRSLLSDLERHLQDLPQVEPAEA